MLVAIKRKNLTHLRQYFREEHLIDVVNEAKQVTSQDEFCSITILE